ncbi:MAG TPA: hypothetical protein DCM87_20425 [Planctomycetes bacterium]|nr:hypothetical protein [Planctomycetota bacterium]
MSAAPRAALAALGLGLWALVFGLPLAALAAAAARAEGFFPELLPLTLTSVALAAALAAAAVALGAVPGAMLAALRRGRAAFVFLLFLPLLFPRYVLFYLWTLPLSPATPLGDFLAARSPELARAAFHAASVMTLVFWYWPLAALIIAQGWRAIDGDVWLRARLEAGTLLRTVRVALPLLARPLACAFGAVFVLLLTEYGTFHLAGIRTLGTELGVLYELTGSSGAVARASLPLAAAAAIAALLLARRPGFLHGPERGARSAVPQAGLYEYLWCALLLGVSCVLPLALLALNLPEPSAFARFWPLQGEGLLWSAGAALLAGGIAVATAGGALALQSFGPAGRALACLLHATIFFTMFIPGALAGAGTLAASAWLPAAFGRGLWPIASGQAACFTGVALVMLHACGRAVPARVRELVALDGARPLAAFRRIYLPLAWPLVAGAFALVALLSLTELPATLLLLPPGVPNFTQHLLNQMHYARDAHVVASCALLAVLYIAAAAAAVLFARVRLRRAAPPLCLAGLLALAAGCGAAAADGVPDVLVVLGRTGDGQGEFLYPRAIDIDAAGNLFVADKTGRIQKLTAEGAVLRIARVPRIEAGKPTGLSVGPDGRLYVADTHYSRVLIFDAEGVLRGEFGSYGTGGGRFIYPTDVAFDGAGRIFVSEYGGNDRISIFTARGEFVRSFGKPGAALGEFSRPAAMAVDRARGILYVADACNHRIVRCSLAGEVIDALGAAGREPGAFAYPYGLALLGDGRLVVCEYGNNRIQVLAPDGRSLACLGRAGRTPGCLAYPWAVAVAGGDRAFIVDAGNNRIQVWRL